MYALARYFPLKIESSGFFCLPIPAIFKKMGLLMERLHTHLVSAYSGCGLNGVNSY